MLKKCLKNVTKGITQETSRSIQVIARRQFTTSNSPGYEPQPLGDGAFTSTSLYTSEVEMTYGGALSFLRRKYTKSLGPHGPNRDEYADVVISGVPYDGAVTYRSGAKLGPRAVSTLQTPLQASFFSFLIFLHHSYLYDFPSSSTLYSSSSPLPLFTSSSPPLHPLPLP